MLSSLLSYRSNVNSQNGEDGILVEINKMLGIKNGFFVEFGAWDGKYLSNTYRLLSDNWHGVYIESDNQRYQDLLKTKELFPKQIETICAFVNYEGDETLDNLLANTSTPKDFDLLSIDIDSFDWQVWYSLKTYRPKIVIIEGNSSILPGIWQIHQPGVCQGSSFTALVALGRSKGYQLVCHTGNLFFVVDELMYLIKLSPIYSEFPELLFNYSKYREETNYPKQVTKEMTGRDLFLASVNYFRRLLTTRRN